MIGWYWRIEPCGRRNIFKQFGRDFEHLIRCRPSADVLLRRSLSRYVSPGNATSACSLPRGTHGPSFKAFLIVV
jgi:hypothetical protein